MSRLLRKGAIIGKAALAMVVAGLLLYGATSLLRAGMVGGGAGTRQPADVAMAIQDANAMAVQGDWARARELYKSASLGAAGDELKVSLCGLAMAEAQAGGDAESAVMTATHLAKTYSTDPVVCKSIVKTGDTLAGTQRRTKACAVYKAVADNVPAGSDSLQALKRLGSLATRLNDAEMAVGAVDRMMQGDYLGVSGVVESVDKIAEQMVRNRMLDQARATYEKLIAVGTGKAKRKAACGLAGIAIRQQRFDDGAMYIESLKGTDGTIKDGRVCERLSEAYASVGRYAEAIPYLESAAAADPAREDIWRLRGRIIECYFNSGDHEKAMAMADSILADSPDRSEIANSLAMCAGHLVVKKRYDDVYALRDRYRNKLAKRQDSIGLDIWCLFGEINRGRDVDAVGKSAELVAEAAGLNVDMGVEICMLGQGRMYAGDVAQRSGSRDAAIKMFAEAQAIFEQVKRQWPEGEGAKRALLNSGVCSMMAGDPATALEKLTDFAENNPTWGDVWVANFTALSCLGAMDDRGQIDAATMKAATAQVVARIIRDNEDQPELVRHANLTAKHLGIAVEKGATR